MASGYKSGSTNWKNFVEQNRFTPNDFGQVNEKFGI